MIGLIVSSNQDGRADSIELAALQPLTRELEHKGQLLARRFELVLFRHANTVRDAAADCAAGQRGACRLEDWQEFLSDIAQEDEAEQLYRVNRYINSYRSRTDRRNWQLPDFWAVPEQLFDRGGDCEDFAIAKYLSLRGLGIPAERLRLVVVYDVRARALHAVLLVSGHNETFVLDNNFKRVLTWAETRVRYKLIYAVNEKSVWIYSA